ncbi:MAG TPA: fatty acid desaturase [Thermoanaerobaculia bacterium]|jgi:beta-carotene hydroxylase
MPQVPPLDVVGRDLLVVPAWRRTLTLAILGAQHLYHLEHHLYPQVPHHNWPELARRLDPHFERAGLVPVRLFF